MSQRRSHEEKLSWCPVASAATHATVKQATDQSTQRVSESGSWLVFYGWRDFVPQVVFPASACSRLEDAVLFKCIFYSLIFCCVFVIFSVMGCEPTIEINRVIEFILYDNLLQVILSLVIVKSVTGNVYLMNCWPLYRWNIQVCRTVPSSSVGKVFRHQWLSRWLKFRRSRFKSRWKREFLKNSENYLRCDNSSIKENFVQCKTGMPSRSVGKVFGHQWLSRWLKFPRSMFKSRWKREFLKNSENYLRCDNSSIKGTLCSAKPDAE